MFSRFAVPSHGTPLSQTRLRPSTELLVAERGGMRRALLVRDMAYHHVAQGELGSEPFLVTF